MGNTDEAKKEAEQCIEKGTIPTDPQVAVCVRRLKEEQKAKEKAKRLKV